MGLLSLLLWTPAIGVLVLAVMPSQNASIIRGVAHFFTLLALLLSGVLVSQYDSHVAALQLSEYYPLNPGMGSAYALGVDGLSMPMLVLAALLTAISLQAIPAAVDDIKGFLIAMMLLEFGMLGVFLAQDWALFYVFWEVTLITLYFLLSHWGGRRRHPASLNFALYALVGSVCMLISLLAISEQALEQGGSLIAPMQQGATQLPLVQQVFVLAGFLVGFGVLLPIFPLHGWQSLAHVQVNTPVSILLSGVLLKMGAYGLLRVVAMLPEAAHYLQPVLVFLAVFGMLHGSLLAWRQSNLKAMLAYASISQMGIVLFGIASLNEAGLIGAILQMTAHGLVAAALFFFVGVLHERTHTFNIQDYSSLIPAMPRFALVTLIVLFVALGLPGSVGFIAGLYTLVASFQLWGWLWIFFGLNVLITAAYIIRTLSLLFIGPVKPGMPALNDLRVSELLAAGVLVLLIVGFGFAPTPLINLSTPTLAELNDLIQQKIPKE